MKKYGLDNLGREPQPLNQAPSYRHGEAYCWMYYSSKDGTIGRWIYNSRDGVTPFICYMDGVELTHGQWNKDLRAPNYQPKTGDLVWRDMTREEGEEVMKLRIENAPPPYNEVEEDRKAEMIKQNGEECVERGEPCLAIVDESGQYPRYNK